MKLLAPQDASGCSFDGKEYEVDEKGFVEVPAEAAAALAPHGFTAVPEKPAKKAAE